MAQNIGKEARKALENAYGPLARFIIDDVDSLRSYLSKNPHLINATGPDALGSKTPLELACHFGRVDVAKLLKELGVDLNALNQNRNIFWSAIFSENDNIELIQWLLDAKVNPNAGSEPAFYTAAFLNKVSILEKLIEYSDVNVKVDQTPALIAACLPMSFQSRFMEKPQDLVLETVKYLIEHNVDLEARDSEGATALLVCAKLEYDIVANCLIEAGGCKDVKMNDGSGLNEIGSKEFLSKLI